MLPRFYSLFFLLLVFSTATASWWSSSDDDSKDADTYTSWSPAQLSAWLEAHNVAVPTSAVSQSDLQSLVAQNWDAASKWTYDQYESAQQAFADIREDIFDKWDESQLRQFLLRQGIVAPKGPREHLVLLAKARYSSFRNAANSLASRTSATASVLGESASSLASSATAGIAQSTKDAFRVLDDTKDYIFSSWSDSQLRSYLEKKGWVKPEEHKTREQLLSMMNHAYAAVTEPIYDAWSDLAMHDWLVTHGVIKSGAEKNRDKLRAFMNKYHYSVKDAVWSTWSESQLKNWLVEHGYVKSDAQLTRDKMIRIVSDNYLAARYTFWDAWSDSDIRDWLIQHNYLRTDAQVKRDELIKMANEKYNVYSARVAEYLVWPDARLRVYLREKGISEELLPTSRPGLLQETRIRWIQVQNHAEAAFNKIRDIVNEGVYKAEEGLGRIWSILAGTWNETKEHATEKAHEGYSAYKMATESMKNKYEHTKESVYDEAVSRAEQMESVVSEAQEHASQARQTAGETMKQGGERLSGEL